MNKFIVFCFLSLSLFLSCAGDNTPLLGIRVNIGDDIANSELPYIVHEVFHDSPAYNAGLRPGDIIVQIDDTSLDGLVNDYIYENLVLGKKGTSVRFKVKRDEQYFIFTIIRGKKR